MEAQIHEPFIELQPDPIAFIDRLLRLELKPREWGLLTIMTYGLY